MVYSPCYHGKHNIDNYGKMRKEIGDYIECIHCPDDTIDIYLSSLFEQELTHWFLQIFFYAYQKQEEPPMVIKFYHKDKKILRKARQLLRKLRLPYTDIKKYNEFNYIVSDTKQNG